MNTILKESYQMKNTYEKYLFISNG